MAEVRGPGARAGDGQEIYLIPTVTVGPSEVSLPNGDPGEFGLEPGFPEPNANNANSDARLDVTGSIRETPANIARLPVSVEVEDLATFNVLGMEMNRSLSVTQHSSVAALVSHVRSMNQASASSGTVATPVPRFSVTEEGGSKKCVDCNFTRFPQSDSAIAPASGFDAVQGRPAFVFDRSSVMFLFHLEVRTTADADVGKHKIMAHSFDQSSDDDWQSKIDEGDTNYIEDDLSYGSVRLNDPQIAAVFYQDNIYILITDAGTTTTMERGSLYVYAYRPHEAVKAALLSSTPIEMGTGWLKPNSISALAIGDRVIAAVGVLTGPNVGFSVPLRTIMIGVTADMYNWSSTTENNAFDSLDCFENVFSDHSSGKRAIDYAGVMAIAFGTDDIGWAVGMNGLIAKTQDGGKTWETQDSPLNGTDIKLRSVVAYDGNTAWAVGDKGAILTTSNGGETWLIDSINADIAKQFDDSVYVDSKHKHRSKIGNYDFECIVMAPDSANTLWIVGGRANPNVYYTISGGGETWRSYKPPVNVYNAQWHAAAAWKKEDNKWSIIVGGICTMAGVGTRRLFRVSSAATSNPTWHAEDVPVGDNDSSAISCLSRSAYTVSNTSYVDIWAGTAWGQVLQRDDLTDGDPWTKKATNVGFAVVGIFADYDAGEVVVCGTDKLAESSAGGRIARSADLGATWIRQYVGTETSVNCIYSRVASSVLIAGGYDGLWWSEAGSEYRSYPSLVRLAGGAVLLAAANLERGKVEFFRSGNAGRTFSLVELNKSAFLTFAPLDDNVSGRELSVATLPPDIPSTALVVADDGSVICVAGCDGIVAPDGQGFEWLANDDPLLQLGLGDLEHDPEFTVSLINKTRSICAYGGGRLFSCAVGNVGNVKKLGTFASRGWTDVDDPELANFMPIIPGVPQWLGIDDLRCIWSGLAIPIGDKWNVPASYRFSSDKVVIESPSIYFRTASNDGVDMYWDRQDADIVKVAGTVWGWNVTAFALFGTNFRRAKVAITIPTYGAASWPTSDSSYVEFDLSAVIDQGVVTSNANYSTGSPNNVIKCSGKNWIPSQFARGGLRRYFIDLAGTAYEVLDNTRDEILITRSLAVPVIVEGDTFYLYTDRMFCDGSGGVIHGEPINDSLIDSNYQYGRWIRLSVPSQAVPADDGYIRIGTIIFGRHIPLVARRPGMDVERDRLGPQRWQLIPHTEEQYSITGVGSVQHFGRVRQRWSFAYNVQYWWDRDHTLAPLIPRMRQAFALVFDNSDPVGTLELVRLASDIPEIPNRGGDLWDMGIVLDEVV